MPSAAIVSRPRAVDRSRIQRTRPAIPSRAKRCRVHRIPSRVRDDRDTPLEWDETVSDIGVIWVKRKQQYFCLWDSTAQITPNLARRAGDFFTRRRPPSRRHRKIRHVGQISERSPGLNASADKAVRRAGFSRRRNPPSWAGEWRITPSAQSALRALCSCRCACAALQYSVQ